MVADAVGAADEVERPGADLVAEDGAEALCVLEEKAQRVALRAGGVAVGEGDQLAQAGGGGGRDSSRRRGR